MKAAFIGYEQYGPFSWRPKFQIKNHPGFPDGSIVNWETLRGFRIPIPRFPSFCDWRRERFKLELRAAQEMRKARRGPTLTETYQAALRTRRLLKSIIEKKWRTQ